MTRTAPPIPAAAADRPTTRDGLVIPYVNIVLADGGVDFRAQRNTRTVECWRHTLCQLCARPLRPDPIVLLGGAESLERLLFDEPPLHPACARYVGAACPMVRGDLTHYATGLELSARSRGKRCPDPGCDCDGIVPTPGHPRRPADAPARPAHAWYAVWVRDYHLAYSPQGVLIGGGCAPEDVIRVRQLSAPGAGPMTPWAAVEDWRARYRPPAAADLQATT